MLGFLFRLIFLVLLARLGVGLLRLLRGPRQRTPKAPAPRQEMPEHLREEIVDGEFEDVRRERER